jgi:hypothetical protein
MTRVFIHSWHGDFAKTETFRESEYLGRAVSDARRRFRFLRCGCGTKHLLRIRRPLWLRILFPFRLYRCETCRATVFAWRIERQRAYPVYW